MTTPHTTDDDLRELFAPLATDEPTTRELAELRRRRGAPRGVQRPRNAITVLAVATVTVAVALAAWPADGGDPTGSGTDASALATAAARAARQPVPTVSEAPLRYVRKRWTFTYGFREGDRVAASHNEQEVEMWTGARWRGRVIGERGRTWLTGDIALGEREFRRDGTPSVLTEAVDRPLAHGDGPLAELDAAELPDDRDGIAEALREGIRTNRWSADPHRRGRPDDVVVAASDASYVTYSFIGLLVDARLTPAQRAALLDVLASDPAAKDLGRVRDRVGRVGEGVELSYEGRQLLLGAQGFRVIFDRETSEILEWRMWPRGDHHPLTPARVETVLQTGYVREVRQRP